MSDPLSSALKISGSGISAQSIRMRVVSENLANANSTGTTPGSDPYQRKTVSFVATLDRASGANNVQLGKVGLDTSGFRSIHSPSHVAADESGMVKMPNVDMLLELADMREAVRSYQANVRVAKQAREMISMTIDMMRN